MNPPTVAEAMEFARDLPADCHADRCLIALRAEVEKWKTTAALWADLPAKVDRLTTRAEKAERDLAEARKDTERIDALEVIMTEKRGMNVCGRYELTRFTVDDIAQHGLRAVLDDCMKGAKP